MPYQGPGEERVFLTAYERRQFELIEQSLAGEDPGSFERRSDEAGDAGMNPIWITLVVGGGWLTLIGMAATSLLLLLPGTFVTAGALAMHVRACRKASGSTG